MGSVHCGGGRCGQQASKAQTAADLDRVAGPTKQQACDTSVRALLVMADRQSNGPLVSYPDPTGTGGDGMTEHWVPDNLAQDPFAKNPMLQTGENMAVHFGISTAEQHALKLHRCEQYLAALADDLAFYKRYIVDAPLGDLKFRKQAGGSALMKAFFRPRRRLWSNSNPSKRAAPSHSAGKSTRRMAASGLLLPAATGCQRWPPRRAYRLRGGRHRPLGSDSRE